MKLTRSTWLLLLLAAILGALVYLDEIRREHPSRSKVAVETQQQKLFDFDLEAIQRIVIQRSPATLELVKNSDKSATFSLKQPEEFLVNEGVMAFLLNLIEQGTSDRQIAVSPAQLAQYGLEPPVATITIELKNQQTHQILLGKATINPEVIYAQINPTQDSSPTEVLLVSKNWHYAIERDLQEWQRKSG
ncbi:MAG TPA: DUF4340 domain-containing protein [Xenococcaceae cyanobacterium]